LDISLISRSPMRISGWLEALSARRVNAGANRLNGSSR
jgi:hypothetical protein